MVEFGMNVSAKWKPDSSMIAITVSFTVVHFSLSVAATFVDEIEC